MSEAPLSSISGFAERVVDYEIQFEKDKSNLSHFKDLISLLVEGIEYYQSINDDRYLYYKEKMDKLLLGNKKTLKSSRFRSPEAQASDTIRDYEQKNKNFVHKIQSNLSIQNGSLTQRLNIRRKTFCAGIKNNDLNNKLQIELVETIEDLLKEKKIRVKEVRQKYQTALTNGNYLITIEQLNKEVEDVESEIEQRKRELVNKIFSNK